MQVAAVRKLGEDGDIVGFGCRIRGVGMFSAGMFSARLLGFGCFGCVGVAGRCAGWLRCGVGFDFWQLVFVAHELKAVGCQRCIQAGVRLEREVCIRKFKWEGRQVTRFEFR